MTQLRLALFCCLFLWGRQATAQDAQPQPWNVYLQQRTEQLEQQSRHAIAAVTAADWPEVENAWRQQLQEMLGLSPWPERGDLKIETTGQFAADDYAITRFSYQPSPGLYVAANLYRPTGTAPPAGWPAVLYVCGHANVRDEGRLLGNKTSYQHHGLWFARHGVVCMIIDTVQLGEFHGEHHGTYKMGKWDWISRGYTPAGVEAWSSMRAVDYLQSLPDVDKDNIGITGRSGGGAYSWFTAALDRRIKAAVPVAGITDLRNHIVDGCVEGHCDCMYFVNYHGWDYNRLAALIAPRALLLANSDHDSIFPLDGVIRIHNDVAGLYAKLGVPNKFGLLLTPGPHQDTQELQVGAFRWLLNNLTSKPILVDRAATKELPTSALQVYTQETPADQRVTDLSSWFVPAADETLEPAAAAERWRQQWAERLTQLWQATDQGAAHQYRQVLQGSLPQLQYRWLEQVGEQLAWRSHILMLNRDPAAAVDSLPTVIHIGVGLDQALTPDSLEHWLQSDTQLKQLVDTRPEAMHVVLLPRSQQLWSAALSVRQRTQLERRFYLLGDTTERLALADIGHQLNWLKSLTSASPQTDLRLGPADAWQVIGHGRQAPLAALTLLHSYRSGEPNQGPRRLTLIDYPQDWRLAATLPGMARVMSLENLLATAKGLLQVTELATRSPSELGEGYDAGHRLLVDTASAPQQANGLRTMEPSADAVTVWCRATRWPLPNLGDQPAIEFGDDPAVRVRERRVPILPADGTAGLRYATPGVPAELRVRYRPSGKGNWLETPWEAVDVATDYAHLFRLTGLAAETAYELQCQARAIGSNQLGSSLSGTFRTLPPIQSQRDFRLAIGTCQEFEDRDGEHGMDLYRTLLHRKTDAYILAGDVVYYDKLARSVPLAYYHWQRTYSLPTLVNFHRSVPTFFLKDDHDTYVNDSWPGQYLPWTRQFTFEDGQRIFREQTGLPDPAYRTVQIGRDLQLWLMEGRDYRDANSKADGPDKSIWGQAQWEWLERSLSESTATFKVIVSPTPIVGPDRENKNDNHSNKAFTVEGQRVRKLLAGYKNLVVVCGDRHWQYHSRDPETGLHEFSVGPVTNRHAGGWPKDDFRKEIHQYMRVAGGYLEINLTHASGAAQLSLAHRDPYGELHHEHRIPSAAGR